MVQPCIWFKEEPSQFSMGQTTHSLTCSNVEKPHTRLDECPRILLPCFEARNSGPTPNETERAEKQVWNRDVTPRSNGPMDGWTAKYFWMAAAALKSPLQYFQLLHAEFGCFPSVYFYAIEEKDWSTILGVKVS